MSKSLNPASDKTSKSKTVDAPPFVWEARLQGSRQLMWRYSGNPLLGRRAIPRAQAIYNSAIVPFGNGYVGIFRADHMNGQPNLHLGHSRDGLHWDIQNEPLPLTIAAPELADHEYRYDPRVCEIDGTHYITWCAGYHGPTIGIARTNDFAHFEQLENAFLPCNRNGVLFPTKINGRFAMLSRPSDRGHTPFGDIFYSESPDLCFWGKHRHVMASGSLWWESVKIGAGPIPIATKEGWLLLYHGVRSTCNGLVYSIGMALLDLDQPWKVRRRFGEPVLLPEEPYETTGFVPNVTFPCSALHDEPTGRIAVYYGAADTSIAVAFCHRDELVSALLASSPNTSP